MGHGYGNHVSTSRTSVVVMVQYEGDDEGIVSLLFDVLHLVRMTIT